LRVAFIVLGVCSVISVVLGFVIKRIMPKLHMLMCLLISFAAALVIAAAIIKMVGGFGS
jgi:membrane-bound ClpP family serine protease